MKESRIMTRRNLLAGRWRARHCPSCRAEARWRHSPPWRPAAQPSVTTEPANTAVYFWNKCSVIVPTLRQLNTLHFTTRFSHKTQLRLVLNCYTGMAELIYIWLVMSFIYLFSLRFFNPNPIERNSSYYSVRPSRFYPSKFGAFYVYFQPVSPARTAWF